MEYSPLLKKIVNSFLLLTGYIQIPGLDSSWVLSVSLTISPTIIQLKVLLTLRSIPNLPSLQVAPSYALGFPEAELETRLCV